MSNEKSKRVGTERAYYRLCGDVNLNSRRGLQRLSDYLTARAVTLEVLRRSGALNERVKDE